MHVLKRDRVAGLGKENSQSQLFSFVLGQFSDELTFQKKKCYLELRELGKLLLNCCKWVCCSVLWCVAVRCGVLWCVAVCCGALQCVAVCCVWRVHVL